LLSFIGSSINSEQTFSASSEGHLVGLVAVAEGEASVEILLHKRFLRFLDVL